MDAPPRSRTASSRRAEKASSLPKSTTAAGREASSRGATSVSHSESILGLTISLASSAGRRSAIISAVRADPDFAPVCRGLRDEIIEHYRARGEAIDDEAGLRTLDTNSTLVPQRAELLIELLARRGGLRLGRRASTSPTSAVASGRSASTSPAPALASRASTPIRSDSRSAPRSPSASGCDASLPSRLDRGGAASRCRLRPRRRQQLALLRHRAVRPAPGAGPGAARSAALAAGW